MSKLTFEQLPQSLTELHEKLDELKLMIIERGLASEKEDKPLNVKEAAAFMNLAVSTVYNKVSEREIPFRKISKRLYFSKKDLLAYIEEGRKGTISELQNLQQLKKLR